MVNEGDRAPSFALSDQDGTTVRLEDERGKWVVLWWYPKASTPGWTIEGQGFRDRTPQYTEAGATILGISFDSPADNKKFAEEQGFPYRLLSDEDRAIGSQYGAAKGPDEQYPDFPKRVTFLIDPEGVVRRTYSVSDTAAHPEEVLADIRQLA